MAAPQATLLIRTSIREAKVIRAGKRVRMDEVSEPTTASFQLKTACDRSFSKLFATMSP